MLQMHTFPELTIRSGSDDSIELLDVSPKRKLASLEEELPGTEDTGNIHRNGTPLITCFLVMVPIILSLLFGVLDALPTVSPS